MKTVDRRLCKLEDQFGTGSRKPRLLLVACKAGWGLALDMDACLQILGECGFLPTDRVGLVNLTNIPEGLSAQQTEELLRENGPRALAFVHAFVIPARTTQ
jgi:hypothetical protein